MTTAGSFDAPIEIFGGLVTDMSPADLPHGVSPDCQDVIYSNGGVATRPGLQALFGPLAGNPTINYVKTYETLNATLRTLLLDSNGILYKETTPGTLASVATGLAANSYANSTTLFGREYLAISDGRSGNDLPRQFDDTNFDRVSQSGPGAGPTVADETWIGASPASPNGGTQPERRKRKRLSRHHPPNGRTRPLCRAIRNRSTARFPSCPFPAARSSPTSPVHPD